jgi:hypothetical protein
VAVFTQLLVLPAVAAVNLHHWRASRVKIHPNGVTDVVLVTLTTDTVNKIIQLVNIRNLLNLRVE